MSDFLTSSEGLRLRYAVRFMRRRYIQVEGIEPRSKDAMPLDDKVTVQQAVLHHMESRRQKAFRGPLVLEVRATTTERTPSHAQTIAKNLLDLLGPPLPVLALRRRGILYFDDSQVRALSVSVEHGASSPQIHISAWRYGDFLEDLSLAWSRGQPTPKYGVFASGALGGTLLRGEKWLRPSLGDHRFEDVLRIARYDYQGALLGLSPLGVHELAPLLGAPFGLNRAPADQRLVDAIEEHSGSNPFRIVLPELPQRPGTTKSYRAAVNERINDFKTRFARALRPLLHPVAMEVLIKPPPPGRQLAVHDLDNVARDYLIPAIAAQLQPPFYGQWAQIRAERGRPTPGTDPRGADDRSRLPKSTLIGLTRYSVFQQARPLGDSTPGSVTVSLVADEGGYGSIFREIDSAIERWESAL